MVNSRFPDFLALARSLLILSKRYLPSLYLEGVQAVVMAELLTSTGLAAGFIEDTQYKTRGVLFQISQRAPSSAQSCLVAFILLKSKLSSGSGRTTRSARSAPLTPFHLLPTSPHHHHSAMGFYPDPYPTAGTQSPQS